MAVEGNRIIRIQRVPGTPPVVVVVTAGELDTSNASLLASGLERALAFAERPVVLDLSHVSFVDASILGAINKAQRSGTGPGTAKEARAVRVRATTRCVRKVFEICGMDDLLLG